MLFRQFVWKKPNEQTEMFISFLFPYFFVFRV